MLFKEECVQFLDNLVAKRTEGIEKAKAQALETEYVPYVTEATKAKDDLVAEETRKKDALIASIVTDYERKVTHYNEETEKAIEKKRLDVLATAEKTASLEYDTFISKFTSLARETNIFD